MGEGAPLVDCRADEMVHARIVTGVPIGTDINVLMSELRTRTHPWETS
jgi:hypothetical protein